MRRIIYSLLAAAPVLLSGCVNDGSESVKVNDAPDGSMTLNVSLPEPLQQNMNTRAGAADFDALNDLNIVITEGIEETSAVLYVLHFDLASAVDGQSVFGDTDSGYVVYDEREQGFGLHFSPEWFNYIGIPETASFFLVGNYGAKITDVATVGALRNIKDEGIGGWVNRDQPMMFAEAATYDNNHGHDEIGVSMTAALVRTAAMITLKIDGSQLDGDVTITPVSVSLHRVPAYGLLGRTNIVTTAAGGTTPIDGAVLEAGEAFDASAWGPISSDGSKPGTSPVVGGHYTDWEESLETPDRPDIDWSNTDIAPLFLYENYHGGDDFGAVNDTQKSKRPASAAGVSEGEIDAAAQACSYLQVTARYHHEGEQSGTVTFRVFLGADVMRNFDVLRNTYYRFTLYLKNTAIGEGNTSWRLATNLSLIEVIDSDFTFNGNGDVFPLDLMTSHKQFRCEVDGDEWDNANGQPFVFIGSGTNWKSISEVASSGNVHVDPISGGYRAWFYVAPMIPGDTWNGGSNKRTVVFRCWNSSGGNTQYTPWITVNQHAPMSVRVDDETSPAGQWVTETLGKALPATIFVDRLDRDAQGWGFNGLTIAENQTSGFENGYVLMENNTPLAEEYLPFGDGSAMMHAAFMHYYHRSVSNIGLNTGGILSNNQLPEAPSAGDYAYAIPSVAEWQILDQLNGQEPLFDPAFEILPWVNYWTSDAVEGSSTESYVYRLGSGPAAIDRTAATSYRMIYFKK